MTLCWFELTSQDLTIQVCLKVSENGAASKPVDASQWFKSTYSPPGSEGSSSTRKYSIVF